MGDEVHVHEAPAPTGRGGGGTNWVVGLLIVVVLAIVLWFAFGRRGGEVNRIEADIDINLPALTGE
ncbi:MAG TPA: hypothetical protein VMN60_01675 [Longimicrobiales bacterium]|nr:hypothetical protein [Longimicrobiales bacterium]